MAPKIKGLYVAVELDQTKLAASIKSATQMMKTEFDNAMTSVGSSLRLNTGSFESSLSDIAKSINRIQNVVKSQSEGELFSDIIKDSDDLKNSLEAVAVQAGVSSEALQKILSKAVKSNQIKEASSAFNSLAKKLDLSGDEAVLLAKDLGITGEALDKIIAKQTKIERGAPGFFTNLKNLMTGGNAMAAIQSSLATLGANISVAGIVELGKSAVDTTVKLDSLKTAYTSIYRSSQKASTQMAFLKDTAAKLGLEFYATAEAAKGFFAAAENSTIKDDANRIFLSFSAAASALKMTREQSEGMFLALSQMLSKGKISAEEMRQQLAERLPGAVELLARAIGKSLPELDKMFERGEVSIENLAKMAEEVATRYGDLGLLASRSLLGELNKLETAWIDFKAEFFNSEDVAQSIRKVREIVISLTANFDKLQAAVKILFSLWAAGVIASWVNNMANFADHMKKAANATKALTSALKGMTIAGKALSVVFMGGGGLIAAAGALSLIFPPVEDLFKSFFKTAEKSTFSINDLRKGFVETAPAVADFAEEIKGADESMRRYYEAVKRTEEIKLLTKIREHANSFGNLIELISEDIEDLNLSMREAAESGNIDILPDATKKHEALTRFRDELNSVFEDFRTGKIDTDQLVNATRGLFDAEKLSEILQHKDAMELITGAIVKLQKELGELKKDAAEPVEIKVEVTNYEKALERIKLDNIKKKIDIDLSGDKVTKGLADLFLTTAQSGEIVKNGKAVKLSVEELSEALKYTGNSVGGYRYAWYQLVGDSPEMREMFEERLKLLEREQEALKKAEASKKQDKDSTKKAELYKELRKEIDSVNASLGTLEILGAHGAESVAYGLHAIEANAAAARRELHETLEKYKDLGKLGEKEREQLESLSLKLIDESKIAEYREFFQQYVEDGKSAYSELLEAKGEIDSAELASLEESYNKKFEALTAWKELELQIHAESAEKRKQIEDDYASYVAGLSYQLSEAREETQENVDKKSNSWATGFKLGIKELESDATGMAGKVGEVTTKAFRGMSDTLAEFVVSADKSWKSVGEAFSELARSIIEDLAKIAMREATSNIARGMFGGMTGGWSLPFSLFADGGVVNSGLGSFTNGVYNTPTFFATNGGGFQRYANGGVFGEAGPEAIMPLTRMPNGRLGVASTGGGNSGNVQVNVYNSSNSKAEVRQSESANGGKTIDVLIGDVVAKQMNTPGSKLNRTVSTYTGGQQVVTRR